MNHATLAPQFTAANAGEMARRAAAARVRNAATRRAQFLASPDAHARKEIEKQIQKVFRWMEKTDDKKEYFRLCMMLDRLWPKAYAEVRPTKRPVSRPPMPVMAHEDWPPANASPQRPAEPPTPDWTPVPVASPPPPAQILPPVFIDPVPAQTATASPKPVFDSRPVEVTPQGNGPKIVHPRELGAMMFGPHRS